MEQDGNGVMVRLLGCISMDGREEYLLILMATRTSAEETADDSSRLLLRQSCFATFMTGLRRYGKGVRCTRRLRNCTYMY